MSEAFIASGGARVIPSPGGVSVELAGETLTVAGSVSAPALREYFEAERDKELGLWRWPEDRRFAVQRVNNNTVDVMRLGRAFAGGPGVAGPERITRNQAKSYIGWASSNFYRAADDYFEAHPEPKPWHDAKEGQAWVIEYRGSGGPQVALVTDPGDGRLELKTSGSIAFQLNDDRILNAERIWPQEDVVGYID